MAKLTVKQIQTLAEQLILGSPNGIRFTEIANQISSLNPETPATTIQSALSAFGSNPPATVSKPARGLYEPASSATSPFVQPTPVITSTQPLITTQALHEEDFYQPFASWLQSDIEEVVQAVALGGSGLKGKWSTPDVVGVYRSLPKHRIRFGPEIVSAEIKMDPAQPVVAFGQARAQRNSPDMFFVNQFEEDLLKHNSSLHLQLF